MKINSLPISTPALLPASPSKAFEQLTPVNYQDVFECGSSALSVVKRDQGKQAASAYISIMLADIEQFFNVKNGMTEIQIKMLVDMILKNFFFLKISDLRLFAEKFKMGLYGKVYDRIDGGVIMQALNQYTDERMNEAEAYNAQKASRFKMAGEQAATNILQAIAERWKDARPEKEPKPVFRSVAQYAQYYGIDEKELGRKLAQAVSDDYDRACIDMDYNEYTQYWMNQWLFDKTVEARNRKQ